MIKPDIVNYIKKELTIGTSKDTLANSLKVGGWAEQDIADSFAEVERLRHAHSSGLKVEVGSFSTLSFLKVTFTIIFIFLTTFLVVAYILGGQA